MSGENKRQQQVPAEQPPDPGKTQLPCGCGCGCLPPVKDGKAE